jgi:hypothetical protein
MLDTAGPAASLAATSSLPAGVEINAGASISPAKEIKKMVTPSQNGGAGGGSTTAFVSLLPHDYHSGLSNVLFDQQIQATQEINPDLSDGCRPIFLNNIHC